MSIIFLPCMIPCLIWIIKSILQNYVLEIVDNENVKKVKLMKLGQQENEPETAKEIYEKYQHLQKVYRIYEEEV